ncbi:MAG TPA: hypothetical protein VN084_00420, partial [Methylophilaceae bacterium]|nr:hypothetical protein [Methylophilaceae bacterium]
MTPVELTHHLQRLRRSDHWYKHRAAAAVDLNWYEVIPSRSENSVYLVRFWLNKPAIDGSGKLDSSNATLLHWFVSHDDDGALHDHPWDFSTTVLAGGYIETTPARKPGRLGPGTFKATTVTAGATLQHEAADLHAIAGLLGETWTLVTTGPRIREWGFHPPGQAWADWRTFLAPKRG